MVIQSVLIGTGVYRNEFVGRCRKSYPEKFTEIVRSSWEPGGRAQRVMTSAKHTYIPRKYYGASVQSVMHTGQRSRRS